MKQPLLTVRNPHFLFNSPESDYRTIAVTQHNLCFQAQVMGRARDSILEGTFPQYLRTFFADYFGENGYPEWCVNALRSVGVDLLEGYPNAKVVKGPGVKWDYSDAP